MPYVTLKEKLVWALSSVGLTSREIAERLQVKPRTVKTHRRNLLRKWGVQEATTFIRIFFVA